VDIGFPGNQPYPDQGLPGNQPGIWGPTDPRPSNPIYWPGYPGGGGGGGRPPGRPTHPIFWPPYVDIGFPGPQPYPDQGLPGNQPYPDQSLPPVIDMGQMPEHPELPDLNAGQWMFVNRQWGTIQAAFVPWPLAVTHPDYNPRYPEQGTPGEWVAIVYGGRSVWAWIPSADGGSAQSTSSRSRSKASSGEASSS
jgi:hypothetical protein